MQPIIAKFVLRSTSAVAMAACCCSTISKDCNSTCFGLLSMMSTSSFISFLLGNLCIFLLLSSSCDCIKLKFCLIICREFF
ncbi:hypothetical protein RchiOBHm_Chr5g0031341 [Rosa chinensis]|uniref:Secreted protein n=1 Tax=Rosa chinensis TaxID=74649 RepID=A0A2P6QA58_ROSCH|nr:hypothetical protein RchiOBHm_Chr5g0031341 [Rosa chinensis]